jgi:hypothetical protein
MESVLHVLGFLWIILNGIYFSKPPVNWGEKERSINSKQIKWVMKTNAQVREW